MSKVFYYKLHDGSTIMKKTEISQKDVDKFKITKLSKEEFNECNSKPTIFREILNENKLKAAERKMRITKMLKEYKI